MRAQEKNLSGHSYIFLALLIGILLLFSLRAGAAETAKEDPLNPKYSEFTGLMDGYNGEPATLESAKKLLGEMLQIKERSPFVNIAMGRLALAEGFKNYREYDKAAIKKAEKNFSLAIFADPRLFDPFIYGAYAYLYEDNFAIAEFFAEKAQKIEPDSPKLKLLQAEIALRERKYESALKITEELSKNQEREMLEQAGLLFARIYLAQNKYELAETSFLKLLEKKPDSPWINLAYSTFLMDRNEYERAVQYAERAVQINNTPEARKNLSRALDSKKGISNSISK